MLNIDTLKIIRKPHPLNTQAANRAYKEAFHRTTESLRAEVAKKQGELNI